MQEWIEFAKENPQLLDTVAVSSGITEQDSVYLKNVLTTIPQINYICLDVANGYTEFFVQFVKATRQQYPDKTIIAGNVVTGEMGLLSLFYIIIAMFNC